MGWSGSTTCRGRSGPGGPANLLKLVDADYAIGKDARISSCPPMASMILRSVLMYISERRSTLEMAT